MKITKFNNCKCFEKTPGKRNQGHFFLIVIILLGLLLSLLSCAQNNAWKKSVDWNELDFAKLPGEEAYQDAGAIILLDEGKMNVSLNNSLYSTVYQRHRIIKILNGRGLKYANVAIPYSPNSFVDGIQARTISPGGEILLLDKENIFDINLYPNFIFYSDQRAKLFTMPGVENGSVIEYQYNLNIPVKTFGHSWVFQNDEPTLISRFTLLEPMKSKIDYRLYGIDIEPTIAKAPAGFKSKYVWEARNIPAVTTEYGMPPMNECTAHLKMAPLGIKNWEDVSKWYFDLAEPQIKAGEAVKKMAQILTQHAENDREKMKSIYEWIRDNIRYIAVSIGVGSFQPHPAEEVLNNRYGDCKDMTTLLCSMARHVGIEAHEVLISTWYNGKADTSLPTPYQFNHVIAFCPAIGDSGLWLDATEKGCPFGILPWYDEAVPVLVIGPEGKADLRTTPRLPAENNRVTINWQVSLQVDGSASVQGSTEFSGGHATALREELVFASAAEQERWLETDLAERCSGAMLQHFEIGGLEPVKDPLQISYSFEAANFAVSAEGTMAFCPGDFQAFDLPNYFRSLEREHPIMFRFGEFRELNLMVTLPENWLPQSLESSDSLQSEFGYATWKRTMNEAALQLNHVYFLTGENIQPEKNADFRDFLDQVKIREMQEIVMKQQRKSENDLKIQNR